MLATNLGVPGSDHRWDDLSPEGRAADHDMVRRYHERVVAQLEHPDAKQRHAARVLADYLGLYVDEFESGDYLRDLSHLYCSFTELRDTFDIMPRDSAAAWSNIASRLASLGEALEGWTATLQLGIERGKVVSRRQVDSVVEQMEHLAGPESMIESLLEDARSSGFATDELEQASTRAREAVARSARWLVDNYRPHADDEDGVGEERYLRSAERFLGLVIEPREVYEWGWEELGRLRSELEEAAAEVDANIAPEEVLALLETDPARAVPREEFVSFVQQRLDQAVVDLDGSHFDVPEPVRRISVNLAPPGTALGAWYINPSADWERPGSVWYALGERQLIPTWQEVSTAYHEGFPGHHLQVGITMWQAENLSAAQRLLIWYPGYGEGWALYAERLMDELGYFERPEYRLGMLASHIFRAARVVVDIGLHLGYRIPETAPMSPGEPWGYEVAVDYMEKIGLQPRPMAESEVKRYLGWPGQAISYKLGEREILDLRRTLRQRDEGFDLKAFHHRILEMGAVRLDHLRATLLS